jgi:hypothetical protein
MEFVEGATLREVMGDLGKLEPGQAAAIGERIARALDYAHERGLVHRDVKPANILIGDDGCVKVADFGIAKAEEAADDLTKTGMVLGTAAYVAPEQITNSSPVDGRADQYALGCMLYEALAGRQPFKGDTAVATAAQRLESAPTPLRSLRPDIPRGLDSVVMRAMARDPQDRFVSSGALADALAAFADHDPSHTAALPLATMHRAASGRAPAPTSSSSASWAQESAAVHERERSARSESFLRTEGRWLLAVLVLLGVAAALIGLAMVSGLLDGRLPGVGPDDGAGEQEQARPSVLRVSDAAAFDPQGDGGESDDELANLTDGDRSTTWETEGYNTEEFGGLKDGVGFYLDLGGSKDVSGLRLALASPGVNATIAVADEPHSDVEEWTVAGEITDAGREETVTFDEPVAGSFVLVWITAPLPEGDRYRATFEEVTVLGPAEAER